MGLTLCFLQFSDEEEEDYGIVAMKASVYVERTAEEVLAPLHDDANGRAAIKKE